MRVGSCFAAVAVCGLAIVSCAENSAPAHGDASRLEGAPVGASGTVSETSAQPGAPAGGEQSLTLTGPAMLAYSHRAGLEVPGAQIRPLMNAHEQACLAAGSRICQVLGANLESYGEDRVTGQLSLRAAPAWLSAFRAGLAADARRTDGRITQDATTTEDLTRTIVDSEARLRAQKTLRDRLQSLLAKRPGSLADLLELERELARVQSQIDADQSTLAVMKARVEMSVLDITYTARPNAVSAGALAPLRDAIAGFLAVAATSLAAIVTLTAALLPVALIASPVLWLAWRAWRRRTAKSPPAP